MIAEGYPLKPGVSTIGDVYRFTVRLMAKQAATELCPHCSLRIMSYGQFEFASTMIWNKEHCPLFTNMCHSQKLREWLNQWTRWVAKSHEVWPLFPFHFEGKNRAHFQWATDHATLFVDIEEPWGKVEFSVVLLATKTAMSKPWNGHTSYYNTKLLIP